MEDDVFCKLVKGQAAASLVYSDEKVLAFMDIQPVNPGACSGCSASSCGALV
jgi:histidine triad (HIT) family protein